LVGFVKVDVFLTGSVKIESKKSTSDCWLGADGADSAAEDGGALLAITGGAEEGLGAAAAADIAIGLVPGVLLMAAAGGGARVGSSYVKFISR